MPQSSYFYTSKPPLTSIPALFIASLKSSCPYCHIEAKEVEFGRKFLVSTQSECALADLQRRSVMKIKKGVPLTLIAISIVLLCGMLGCRGNSTTASSGGPTPTPVPSPSPVPTPIPAAPASWTLLDTNVPPPPRFAPAGLFDATNNRLTVFSGRNASDTANLNDVWVLANATGATGSGIWSLMIANGAAGAPPARWGTMCRE